MEEVKKSLEMSPGKHRYQAWGEQPQPQPQKKKGKVLRKAIGNTNAGGTFLNKPQPLQMMVTKSLDRVPSKKNNAQMQINVNPIVQESKMFSDQVKFQSTSTKSNGAKKIKLGDQQKLNPQQIRAVAQGKYSFLSIGDKVNPSNNRTEDAFATKKGRNQAQQQVFTNPMPVNSGNNLQTMPIGLVGGGIIQQYRPNPHPSVKYSGIEQRALPVASTNMHSQKSQKLKQQARPTNRKPSMTNSKKQLDIHSDINTELIQNAQQNYTTKNTQIQHFIEPIGPNMRIQMNMGQLHHPTPTGAPGNNLKLKSQKVSQKQNEFNCLINQPNMAKNENMIGKIYSTKPQTIKANQVIVKAPQHQLQIQKQVSNNSNNSLFKVKKLRSKVKESFEISQEPPTGCNNTFNNTQSYTQDVLEMDDSRENVPKGTTGNSGKKQGAPVQKMSQQKQEIISKHLENQAPNQFGMGNIGPYIIQNNRQQLAQQIAQGVPNQKKLFTQIHGSSSATNKARKAFTFELDNQQKKSRERKSGISTQIPAKKPQIQQQAGQNTGNLGSNKKLAQMQKQTKIKTQMNLTGPLPKNIMSPKATANKSQGKTKHSQYFNNPSEIVTNGQQQLQLLQQQQFAGQLTPQAHTDNNGVQLFYPPQNSNKLQLQLHNHESSAKELGLQPQITTSTQGCNTVININIDSNTFGRQPPINENSQPRVTRNGILTQPSQNPPEQQYQVENLAQDSNIKPIQFSGGYQKRQSSSKMRRNDSVSSNKSRGGKNQSGGGNRRSNSGSQLKQQQYQQMQQLSYAQAQQILQNNQTPKSIIMNNIAKINEKLEQQNLQININKIGSAQAQPYQIGSTAPINFNQTAKVQLPKGAKNVVNSSGQQVLNSRDIAAPNFNQTQKVAVEQPFSVIPKKGAMMVDNITGQIVKANPGQIQQKNRVVANSQKLTVKKISKSKKQASEGVSSQIGSARTHNKPKQSLQPPTAPIPIQVQHNNFYTNDNEKNDAMLQQLQQMENHIQQNQIRLRNELEQMQNSYNNEMQDIDMTPVEVIEEMPFDINPIEQAMQLANKYQTQQAKRQVPQQEIVNNNNMHPKKSQKLKQLKSGAYQVMPPNPKPTRSTGNSSQGTKQPKITSQRNPHKMNIEDINIDIDPRFHQQWPEFNPINYISTKKAVSTRNNQKMHTQQVQSLLREAKREMILDPSENIVVGGDDLTIKNQNKKKFNFNGTQVLGSQANNFNLIQPQSKGFSPANRIIEADIKDFNSQGTVRSNPNTFGLGQINKKKQISPPQNNYNKIIENNQKVEMVNNNTKNFTTNKNIGPTKQPTKPNACLNGTMNSLPSDSEMNRNSNIPPNSASNLLSSETEENSELIVSSNLNSDSTKPEEVQTNQLKLPISGAKVLKHYLKRSGLTEYEKSELLDYKQCFFLGLESEKIKGSKFQQPNFGYDDERGDYNVIIKDHISYRFEVIDFLGKGSFGQAIKCKDHKTGEIVAVKIIRNKKKFQHQANVELKILLHLRDNDPDDTNNIIRIKDYCNFRKHLVISFELFSINLYEFIKNNNFEGVSLSLIRRFAIQILQALKYLREEDLIHCDLKPENILLKSPDKSGIKIIDFGSSCFSNERIYTYIQSRFYRAPEIILGIPYTTAIDMWSFGCILTELFTGVPIFPGESEQEQLSLIIEVLGVPDNNVLKNATRKSIFFEDGTNEPKLTNDSKGNLRVPNSQPLDQVLMCQSESFLDFIRMCLEWNPEKRLTPFDALMHDWIIEGLPAQVLVHHKKMLGIYDSENTGSELMNEYSHNEMGNQSEFDQFHQQIDSQDLSTSQIFNEESPGLHIGKIESHPGSIDFYGNSKRDYDKKREQNIQAKQSRYSAANQAEDIENPRVFNGQGTQAIKAGHGAILLQNSHQIKNQTTNMTDILSQINKKSKSTKYTSKKPIQYHMPMSNRDGQRIYIDDPENYPLGQGPMEFDNIEDYEGGKPSLSFNMDIDQ